MPFRGGLLRFVASGVPIGFSSRSEVRSPLCIFNAKMQRAAKTHRERRRRLESTPRSSPKNKVSAFFWSVGLTRAVTLKRLPTRTILFYSCLSAVTSNFFPYRSIRAILGGLREPRNAMSASPLCGTPRSLHLCIKNWIACKAGNAPVDPRRQRVRLSGRKVPNPVEVDRLSRPFLSSMRNSRDGCSAAVRGFLYASLRGRRRDGGLVVIRRTNRDAYGLPPMAASVQVLSRRTGVSNTSES